MDGASQNPAIHVYDDGSRRAEQAARDSSMHILSFLLSTPPFLPPSVKSRDVARRHSILDLSPEEAEDYLVTDCFPSEDENVPVKTLECLRSLNAQVEQLAALHASDDLEMMLTGLRFRIPEPECVVAAVDLGDVKQARQPLLTLLLRIEGPEAEKESYKYDNLVPFGIVPGHWHGSLTEAQEAQQGTSNSVQGSRGRGVSQSSAKTSTHSFHTAVGQSTSNSQATSYDGQGLTSSDANSQARQPEHEREDIRTHEDYQQQAGGDYFTDPREQWAGYDDESGDDGVMNERSNDEYREKHHGKDGEERKEQEEEEERRYRAMYDQQGDARPGDQAPGAHLELPDGRTRDNQDTVSATHVAELDAQEDDELEADDITFNGHAPGSARSTNDTIRSHTHHGVNAMSGEDRQTFDTDNTEYTYDDQERKDSNDGEPDDHVYEDDRSDLMRLVLKRHSPNPESVTGQSMFDAPPNLSLRDLERYYRTRDMHKIAGTRDRLRLASVGGNDVDGQAVGGAGLLPGIEEKEQAHQIDREEVHIPDPIEALSRAEFDVVVAGDSTHMHGKAVVPRSASMDTLRKLADQNMMMDNEGAHWSEQRSNANESMDAIRAGGFRNFLQMAPSIATDSDAGFDKRSTATAGISLVRLPGTVNEDDENVSTKTLYSDQTDNVRNVRRQVRSADAGLDVLMQYGGGVRTGADSSPLTQQWSGTRPVNNSVRSGARGGVAHNLYAQKARADAVIHAKRLHEHQQSAQKRREAIKMILKGAWSMMEETGNEEEFLRLARESVREHLVATREASSSSQSSFSMHRQADTRRPSS